MTIREYVDLDVAIEKQQPDGYIARVIDSPNGPATGPFVLPFNAPELAQFMMAVGPPRVSSRRLAPASTRETGVRDYGRRLNEALFAGDVGTCFRESLDRAQKAGNDLRIRLRLSAVPELDSIPWEYLFDTRLDRFITLSKETPIVRYLDSPTRSLGLRVEPPLRVLAMISSPSDAPALDVDREMELLKATTGDLVANGLLELVFLQDATLLGLQHALYDKFHVFHFVGHGGFDNTEGEGVLVLENEAGASHPVSGSRLGTLLHDAEDLQLAVINACEGARTSGQDAFSGVAQTLVRQGLPAVVAMQLEISDRAALAFSHEFYFAMSRGKPIEAAMCEVRKAMATSDSASEWGTPVLLRSGAEQPFVLAESARVAAPAKEDRLKSLYAAAGHAIATGAEDTALPILEQLAVEQPDYENVTALLEQVRPADDLARTPADDLAPTPTPAPPPDVPVTSRHTTELKSLVDHTQDVPVIQPAPPHDPQPQPTPQPQPAQPLPVPKPQPPRPQPPDPPKTLMLKIVFGAAALIVLGALYVIGTVDSNQNTPTPRTPTQLAAVTQACGPDVAQPDVSGSIVAACTVNNVNIDGDFSDWSGVKVLEYDTEVFPEQTTAADLKAAWQVTWNKDALYLHARVQDPSVQSVDVSQPSQFFKGDSVSFEFGPDPRELGPTAGLRNGKDLHLMIGVAPDGPLASANPARSGQFVAGGLVGAVEAQGKEIDGGYELEAAVPWSVLNVDNPLQGQVFGMNLNVSDAVRDGAWQLGTMISSNPDRTAANQARPGTWQRLVLATAP